MPGVHIAHRLRPDDEGLRLAVVLVFNDEKISTHEVLLMLMDKRVSASKKIQTVLGGIAGPDFFGLSWLFAISKRLLCAVCVPLFPL